MIVRVRQGREVGRHPKNPCRTEEEHLTRNELFKDLILDGMTSPTMTCLRPAILLIHMAHVKRMSRLSLPRSYSTRHHSRRWDLLNPHHTAKSPQPTLPNLCPNLTGTLPVENLPNRVRNRVGGRVGLGAGLGVGLVFGYKVRASQGQGDKHRQQGV